MDAVTDADRKAAEELRAILADLSGFWHAPGDTGPICAALTRHRMESELRLLEKISLSSVRTVAPVDRIQVGAETPAAAANELRLQRPRPAAARR